jgi:hypothetical protein
VRHIGSWQARGHEQYRHLTACLEEFEMASIIVTSGAQKGDYYPLGQRTNVVGRAESLPIQVLDDLVSRKHMQIHFDKERNRYSVVDMKSKHGVFVNGARITEETGLVDGDQILIERMRPTRIDYTDRNAQL